MPKSQNGWNASASLKRRDLVAGGTEFVGGILDNEDVATVLGYVAEQFHKRVEPLHNPGCWGFYYRANRNDPNSLSNHSSGTAIDINAPKHPNGVATAHTFTSAQIAEVHKIITEVGYVVRWGGDYTKTVDAMHFEIIGTVGSVANVAARLRADAKAPVSEPAQPIKGKSRVARFLEGGPSYNMELLKAAAGHRADARRTLARIDAAVLDVPRGALPTSRAHRFHLSYVQGTLRLGLLEADAKRHARSGQALREIRAAIKDLRG